MGLLTACAAAVVNAQVVLTNGATNGSVATATATEAATTAARTTARAGGNEWLSYAIWGAVIAAIFIFLWVKGYLIKIRNYVEETQEELKKCSWPTREELRGSTVVVMVTIFILGVFTVGVDWVLSNVMRFIT